MGFAVPAAIIVFSGIFRPVSVSGQFVANISSVGSFCVNGLLGSLYVIVILIALQELSYGVSGLCAVL